MALNKEVILQALREAIEWNVGLIDAHKHIKNDEWVPQWKKQIGAYRKEIKKIKGVE